MCLIAWNWQPDSSTPLLVLSNRDEFYERPALPLHWWVSAGADPCVLAGKDLRGGGTWLGVSRSGRFAAITNYRSTEPILPLAPSRGDLVAGFLQGTLDAAAYLQVVAGQGQVYNPFNLLLFDGLQLMGFESRKAAIVTLEPGIGAVSNADFQTPWPKLSALRQRLQVQMDSGETDPVRLLPLLHDSSLSPDHTLPKTGIPLALERSLSAIFVQTPGYGTRACSVVRLRGTDADFTEQSYDSKGPLAEDSFTFSITR